MHQPNKALKFAPYYKRMIHYLQHNAIDQQKWDGCVMSSGKPSLYLLSWYLDAVSPGWNGLVCDDYDAVIPLSERKKRGFSYICQAAYTQYGGVCSKQEGETDADPYLDFLQKQFALVEINLPAHNRFSLEKWPSMVKTNQYLNLNRSYDLLVKDFHRNHRRNILKAQESGYRFDRIDPEAFYQFKMANQSGTYYEEVSVLPDLIRAARDKDCLYCFAAYDKNSNIKAANMIIKSCGRLYLLASENTIEGMANSLMFGLLDHIFRQFAGSALLFDFEGSSLSGVHFFNAGFGAVEEKYYHLHINRLPFPLNLLKGRGKS